MEKRENTVKDGLPTAKKVLAKHYDVDNRVDEAVIAYAMQEYSDQQNAELTRQVAALTHQRDFYRKKFNESKGVHIAKDLGIPENIEMAPIVQSDSDALRERVKELEAPDPAQVVLANGYHRLQSENERLRDTLENRIKELEEAIKVMKSAIQFTQNEVYSELKNVKK